MIRAGEVLQENLPLHELYSVLVQNIFRKKVRPAGEPFVGVQIVGLLETRGIPAEAVLVLGNMEGSFPKRTERELFINESYRRQLGLTTLHHQEQLQDQWFYQLVASVPRVHLFWHEYVDESPRVKSRYLQRLELGLQRREQRLNEHVANGRALPGDFLLSRWLEVLPQDMQRAFETLSRRISARRDERGHFAGDRQALLARLSVGALRDLLLCPYRFLLAKMHVEHEELPEQDADSRQFGQWLHRVLFCFFRGLDDPSLPDAQSDLYHPWMEPIHTGNREQALDRLRRLSKALRSELRGRQESYFQVIYAVWPWLVDEEIARDPWDFDPEDFERNVEATWQDSGAGNLPPVHFSMRIDRLVRSGELVWVLDYKTRTPGTSNKDFKAGLDPQLPLYYYGLIQQGWQGEFIAEYVGLLDRERNIYRYHNDKRKSAPLDEAWQQVEKRMRQRLKALVFDGQPFEPLDGMLCKYCDYKDICRRDEVHYDVRKFKDVDSEKQNGL
ncbi:MAG: PD-(D/E)XK nuclease family protein [candidate division KSB1 bacterium]|nr:PD-(D/E)XK nuclease family protein [candidate division KSB1 bacterium]